MVTYNLGSIGADILSTVPSVPSNLSGVPLWSIIDRTRLYVEQETGASIGSTAIAEKYQPALFYLSTAEVIQTMEMTGIDASSVSLGDFSINKGASSVNSNVANLYKLKGEEALKSLGKTMGYYQTYS